MGATLTEGALECSTAAKVSSAVEARLADSASMADTLSGAATSWGWELLKFSGPPLHAERPARATAAQRRGKRLVIIVMSRLLKAQKDRKNAPLNSTGS